MELSHGLMDITKHDASLGCPRGRPHVLSHGLSSPSNNLGDWERVSCLEEEKDSSR